MSVIKGTLLTLKKLQLQHHVTTNVCSDSFVMHCSQDRPLHLQNHVTTNVCSDSFVMHCSQDRPLHLQHHVTTNVFPDSFVMHCSQDRPLQLQHRVTANIQTEYFNQSAIKFKPASMCILEYFVHIIYVKYTNRSSKYAQKLICYAITQNHKKIILNNTFFTHKFILG